MAPWVQVGRQAAEPFREAHRRGARRPYENADTMENISFLEIATLLGLGIVCLAAVLCTVVRLPGTWVIVAAAAGYGWLTDWAQIGFTFVAIFAGVAVVGEVVELVMSAVTARRAGASRRAGWGALIGGFVGMFIFSLPLPLIGTIFGALVGCFVGALVAELTVKQEFVHGARVGTFSAIGFILGMVTKIALAMMMSAALVGYAALGLYQAGTTAESSAAAVLLEPASLARNY